MALKTSISEARFLLALTAIFCLLQFLKCAYCTEFEVGEAPGWAVPAENGTDLYNEWASKRRFKIDDTLRFMYKKDSVMEVTKKDYYGCNSTRPNFFSNSGHTVYTLDRSGLFYFISGSAGHCEKGQRMIVWVVAQDGSRRTSHAPLSPFSYALVSVILVFQFVLSFGELA